MQRISTLLVSSTLMCAANAVPVEVPLANGTRFAVNKEVNHIPEAEGLYGGDVNGPVQAINWYRDCETGEFRKPSCSRDASSRYEFDRQSRLVREEKVSGRVKSYLYGSAEPGLNQIPSAMITTEPNGMQRKLSYTRNAAGELGAITGGASFTLKHDQGVSILSSQMGQGEAVIEWRIKDGYQLQTTFVNETAIMCWTDEGFGACEPKTKDPGFGLSYGYRSGTNEQGVAVHEMGITTWWDRTNHTIDVSQYAADTGILLKRTISDQLNSFVPAGAIRSAYLMGQRLPNGIRVMNYTDYAFDDTGNWLYRKVCVSDNGVEQQCRADHRTITYHD